MKVLIYFFFFKYFNLKLIKACGDEYIRFALASCPFKEDINSLSEFNELLLCLIIISSLIQQTNSAI